MTEEEKIDWKAFGRADDEDRTLRQFVRMGRVSSSRNGNFQIMDITHGVLLNPRSPFGSIFYFTRLDDAVNYAEARFGNAQYLVAVDKIEQLTTVGGK